MRNGLDYHLRPGPCPTTNALKIMRLKACRWRTVCRGHMHGTHTSRLLRSRSKSPTFQIDARFITAFRSSLVDMSRNQPRIACTLLMVSG